MTRLFARRAVSLLFVLLGISVICFVLSHVVPGNPAAAAAGLYATKEQEAQIRARMGLDRPLAQQYLIYVGHLLRGDFGRSIASNLPVSEEFVHRLPASLELAAAALLLYVPVGMLVGIQSARSAGRWADALTRSFAVFGVSVPVFWLGLLCQLAFAGVLHILPSTGRISTLLGAPRLVTGFYTVDTLLAGNVPAFGDVLRHLALPALVLALVNVAVLARMTRSSMLEVLGQEFVRTARSKGLPERTVLTRHVLRNALIPVVTVIAVQTAALIAWQFLVEYIFAWPGIGGWAVASITQLDFNAIMMVTLFGAVLYVALNFLADVSYMILDPRIRY